MTTRSRTALLWIGVLGGLLLLGVVIGAPRAATGDDFDPHSTAGNGTKALTMLLQQSGASVQVTDQMPGDRSDVAVLLSDTTSEAQTAQLQQWIEAGGVLVVADPESSFAPIVARGGGVFGFGVVDLVPGACDIGALDGLGQLSPSGSVQLLTVPGGSGRCYTRTNDAFVVDTPVGRGHIVALGSAGVFTNSVLDGGSNAGLAVALMAPRSGTRVAVLWGMTGDTGGHGPGLGSLISPGVKLAFVELFLAFLVYAWWRGRRLGRPVLENQPVQIGGSELVSAHGNLLQQTRDPDRAARVLRADLRRRLAERLGLPPGAAPEVVADVTAARAGVDRDVVARAVTDATVHTDAELLALARDIDTIRTEVLHGTAP